MSIELNLDDIYGYVIVNADESIMSDTISLANTTIYSREYIASCNIKNYETQCTKAISLLDIINRLQSEIQILKNKNNT